MPKLTKLVSECISESLLPNIKSSVSEMNTLGIDWDRYTFISTDGNSIKISIDAKKLVRDYGKFGFDSYKEPSGFVTIEIN